MGTHQTLPTDGNEPEARSNTEQLTDKLGMPDQPGGPQSTSATGTFHPQQAGPTLATARSTSPTPFPTLAGFDIERELGRGGMGVVFQARQRDLNRTVAVKMLLGGRYSDPLTQARFLTEAEVVAAIRHPNVVQVYEFGRCEGQPYLVMEYVAGGSLAQRLKQEGRFPPAKAAQVVLALAEGIAAAHRLGVIHRDLKPGNVLLAASTEGELVPKITDFGLAKTTRSDLTASGAILGTPNYMSPEQAAGRTRDVGTTADVYALGAILYELMTGCRPFEGETAMETLQKVVTMEPIRPRSVEPKIPRDLETICLKCLEKDPQKRYATAADLAQDLKCYLEDRPISARPGGILERTWKWARRNPAWAATLVAAVLVLITAGGIGLAVHQRVQDKQRATQAEGLVQALTRAETRQVPGIISDLAAYRSYADPLLRRELADPSSDSQQRLHLSLALLPGDVTQVDYLKEAILAAEPIQVLIVRDALLPYAAQIRAWLWDVARSSETTPARRLRAAAVLAAFDADHAAWNELGTWVVDQLLAENPLFLETWSQMFAPVRQQLLPRLKEVYRDAQPERTVERSVATNLLVRYVADEPETLADLLLDAEVEQFGAVFPAVARHAAASTATFLNTVGEKPQELWPSSDERRERLAKRRANAAAALLRFGLEDPVWPLLQHSPDPRVRSYLLHRLSPCGVDPRILLRRLDVEQRPDVRRALLLALGQYREAALPPQLRRAFLPKLREIYRSDPDAGIHAAAEWLLRQWKELAWLKDTNAALAANEQYRTRMLTGIRHGTAEAGWFVSPTGIAFVVVPGPVEFFKGSPSTEPHRLENEELHRVRIRRSFALSSVAITVGQYEQITGKPARFPERFRTSSDQPMVAVTYEDAARFCNLLSKQEGIPPDQWCYQFDTVRDVVTLRPDSLRLRGYRLPTEAEMEYATRAGAATARHYGETEELLGEYAWYVANSGDCTLPVGLKKPNDFGIFDAHGNVLVWCHERWSGRLPKPSEVVMDELPAEEQVFPHTPVVVRGSAFSLVGRLVRSALRESQPSSRFSLNLGFRVARTLYVEADD